MWSEELSVVEVVEVVALGVIEVVGVVVGVSRSDG